MGSPEKGITKNFDAQTNKTEEQIREARKRWKEYSTSWVRKKTIWYTVPIKRKTDRTSVIDWLEYATHIP